MNQLGDNMIIVTLGRSGVPKDKDVFDRSQSKARDVAMKNHIPLFRIYTEFVEIPDNFTLDRAMISVANNHANGYSILVLGAAGKGDEERTGRRPEGQPAMGSLATTCLETCKVPVLLVKSGPKLDMDAPRLKRQGRDSTPGLNLMVSMDMSKVSERAFDMACKMVTKLDTLYVYHVTDNASSETKGLLQELSLACDKLISCNHVAGAELCEERKIKTIREHIESFIEEKQVDILIMGSMELSKPGKSSLGSVSSAVSKVSKAHCCIVKNFATT